MSQITFLVVGLFLLSACGPAGERGRGQTIGTSSLSWARSHLREGEAATLISPDRRLRLDYQGSRIKITKTRNDALTLIVIPPASVLWHPRGDGVAINNGNGSGQMSRLIVVMDGRNLTKLDGIESQLKAYFFKHTGCRVDPSVVSVSAEAWSMDGSSMWVRFESWDRKTLCAGRAVSFARYDFSRRAVISHLSLSEAMRRFCKSSDFRQWYQPNCDQKYPSSDQSAT